MALIGNLYFSSSYSLHFPSSVLWYTVPSMYSNNIQKVCYPLNPLCPFIETCCTNGRDSMAGKTSAPLMPQCTIYQHKAPLVLVYGKILSSVLLLRSRYSSSITSATEGATFKKNGRSASWGSQDLAATVNSDRGHTPETSISPTLSTPAVLTRSYQLLLLWLTCGYHIAYCLAKLASDHN